jgi:putative membrane protein
MKKNSPVPIPSRQSPLAILLFVTRFARNLIRQFWPLILILFFNPGNRNELSFLIGIIALSFFSMLASVLAYFKFYFHLTDDSFYLEQGILRKKAVQIPFERIQSVKIEQSIIHQAFNIVKIEIETAGSKANELTITAISKPLADSIKDYIFEQKKQLSGEAREFGAQTESAQGNSSTSTTPATTLFQLDFLSLIKIGISQNHLRTLGIILVFFLGLFNRIMEIFGPKVDDYMEEIEVDSLTSALAAGVLIIPFLLVVAILISAVQLSFRYADFVLLKTTEGLRLNFGLFTRIEQLAIKRKMQLVIIESNPLRRLFKMVKIRIYQAASSEVQVNESIVIPGCYTDQMNPVIQTYLDPSVIERATFNTVDPKYRMRLFLLAGMLPLLGLSILAYFNFGWYALYIFGFIPFLAWIVYLYHKRLQFAISEEYVIKKQGILNRKITLLKTYKIQSVEIYQGFYQLRHGLATVILHTAARPVTIPFVSKEQAQIIADFVLAKVEQDPRHWM